MTNAPQSKNPFIIEACVASVESAVAAERAGADRLELNQALELDGLTPSAGLVCRVVDAVKVPVIAMARPRSGGFCYTPDEWTTLTADAAWLLEQGVAGIAFGALTTDHRIDDDRCTEIRKIAGSRVLVFHKAFDEVTDPDAALQTLIDTGIDRVMTSGLADTAMMGASIIERLQQTAENRIEILPAGQIGSHNFVPLLSKTGCQQIHGSFSHGAGPAEEIRLICAQAAATFSR